jgi:hypothetical protein
MAYAEYHKACLAGDVAKILDSVAARNRRDFEAFGAEKQAVVVAFLRERPAGIRIGTPALSAGTATFSVEGQVPAGRKANASVTMVMEEGKWKLSLDKWTMQ